MFSIVHMTFITSFIAYDFWIKIPALDFSHIAISKSLSKSDLMIFFIRLLIISHLQAWIFVVDIKIGRAAQWSSGGSVFQEREKIIIDCFHLLVLIVTKSRKTTSSHIPAHHRASHSTVQRYDSTERCSSSTIKIGITYAPAPRNIERRLISNWTP